MTYFRRGVLIVLVVTAGCVKTPRVPIPPTGTVDATPPQLQLGTAGLKKDILLTNASTAPEERRAKRSVDVLLRATARDAETGIQNVLLDATLTTVCGEVATRQNFVVNGDAPRTGETLPVEFSQSYVFQPGAHLAGCRETPSSVTLTIVASAVNGAGTNVVLPPASVSAYGPDLVRVGTFNMYQPGNHADDVYRRWGRELASLTDVILLTEVPDQRRADLVAAGAGFAHAVKMADGDVAIVSRTPLYDVRTRTITPRGWLTSRLSHVMSARTNIHGAAHQFIVTHWGIRDEGDVLPGADRSTPARLQAPQAVLSFAVSDVPVFVGGDMNAYSGAGPQDHDGDASTPDVTNGTDEIALLRTRFRDPFVDLGVTNDRYCSNSRIDYVMNAGPTVPVSYEACFTGASPSDHPYVLATFEPGDR
jgi:hypothetical protein